MSTHSKSSLISDPITEITSYDIPLQNLSRDHDYYDDLPYVETTTFVNGDIQFKYGDGTNTNNATWGTNINPSFDHELDDESSTNTNPNNMSHGFFLGKESLQNLSVVSSRVDSKGKVIEEGRLNDGDGDDDSDEEDEGIGEIYRSNHDSDSWVSRRSDRSFKKSPEPTPRHALSQKIGSVGAIGQNIALGHRLGVLTEDASLIPKKVKLNALHFLITEDSPVQTDITWSKPNNASSFASLVYKIEVSSFADSDSKNHNFNHKCNNGDDFDINIDDWDDRGGGFETETSTSALRAWTQLADVRWPILRIYHTDDKLFLGKLRVSRLKNDVSIKIRIRTNGELVLPDRTRHWTMSSYSKITEVTFAGYDYCPTPSVDVELQQTHL